MDETGNTLATADCSSTESTHSAFAKTQQRHGFQVSHNFGTDRHEARLLGTVKYHNSRTDFITNDECPLDMMPEPRVMPSIRSYPTMRPPSSTPTRGWLTSGPS